jgi:cardiolipin synthase
MCESPSTALPARHDLAIELLSSGSEAYATILDRVRRARRSIDVRAFVWFDDEAGNRLGEALLEAAERGVRIRVLKDRIAAVYEYMGGTRQSFFHKRVDRVRALQAWVLGRFYGAPGPMRQEHNRLASALLAHPNVSVEHHAKRFDHAKTFVFDDEHIVLGSMGIGNDHRQNWHDVMIVLEGRAHVGRLERRLRGEVRFDPSRVVDFLVHRRGVHASRACELAVDRLALIDRAVRTLSVEMAYLGDARFTDAIVRAVGRGVKVLLVTSRSDVLGYVNLATCEELLRRTRGAENLRIVLTRCMTHSKIVAVDGAFVDVGSANFTRLSHGVYDEVNAYVADAAFARRVEEMIASHADAGVACVDRVAGHSPLLAWLERAAVAWQSRRAG